MDQPFEQDATADAEVRTDDAARAQPSGSDPSDAQPVSDDAGEHPPVPAGEFAAGSDVAEHTHAGDDHPGLVGACQKVALDFIAMRVDKTTAYTRRLMESTSLGEIAHVQGEFLRDLMVDYTYGIAQMTYTRAAEALRHERHPHTAEEER
jgi:hypothetical protein